jgi:hypothetical protein
MNDDALMCSDLGRSGFLLFECSGTKYNPIFCPLYDEHNDKHVGPPAYNYNTTLTPEQHENIAMANDASNSDMDWSDDGQGGVRARGQTQCLACRFLMHKRRFAKTGSGQAVRKAQSKTASLCLSQVYISYGWSNQVSYSNMFLAAAEVRNATQREWLESFFDD